jgi:hypothetical protein
MSKTYAENTGKHVPYRIAQGASDHVQIDFSLPATLSPTRLHDLLHVAAFVVASILLVAVSLSELVIFVALQTPVAAAFATFSVCSVLPPAVAAIDAAHPHIRAPALLGFPTKNQPLAQVRAQQEVVLKSFWGEQED